MSWFVDLHDFSLQNTYEFVWFRTKVNYNYSRYYQVLICGDNLVWHFQVVRACISFTGKPYHVVRNLLFFCQEWESIERVVVDLTLGNMDHEEWNHLLFFSFFFVQVIFYSKQSKVEEVLDRIKHISWEWFVRKKIWYPCLFYEGLNKFFVLINIANFDFSP